MDIAALEAAVRASWDREALEIYADHLQAIGDPRGELVAIDLRIDPDVAVIARRTELIAEWFGADVPPGIVRYGFVDVDASGIDADRQLVGALRGPGAAFVRSVRLAGDPQRNKPALAMLAAFPHPWLTSLSINQWQEPSTPLLDAASTAQLFAQLPALVSLELVGRNILGNVAHPNVQRLRISGFDATAAATWPSLTTLDFAFHCQYATDQTDPTIDQIANLLVPSTLPQLASLDLSRNEPGHTEPRSLGGAIVTSAFFARFANHPALATVALPSLRHEPAVQTVERTLAQLPALREVSIWAPNPRLPHHPTATIREIPIDPTLPGPKRLA
jgi:hypothetical protein